jgi:hypothetical protein
VRGRDDGDSQSEHAVEVGLKRLLIAKSAVEILAGLAFALFPGSLFVILLGTPLELGGLFAFRMFGAAIFAIGLACWLACSDSESQTARGLVLAMLVYDAAFVAILLSARLGARLSGIGLWPVVILHSGLGIASLLYLKKAPTVVRTG